jgi:hypothetical protein
MFDPAEFLTIARELAEAGPRAGTTPARLRTAFGRVYYALYLLVREELTRRYSIPYRHLPHGAVYTHLQSPRVSGRVRELGRDLQRMYRLRQKADYELAPDATVKGELEDAELVGSLARLAEERAKALPQLDFSPILPLLLPFGGQGPH